LILFGLDEIGFVPQILFGMDFPRRTASAKAMIRGFVMAQLRYDRMIYTMLRAYGRRMALLSIPD
jgi:hypothetical protein